MRKTAAIILISIITGIPAFAWNNDVNIHGFISQGFLQTDTNNYIADAEDGTFQFNEIGLNFITSPMDKLLIGVQFFARDFGDLDNDNIILDWAFADYRFFDWFGLRAEKIKNPSGFYSDVRDVDMLRTFITLPNSVYDENLRETAMDIQGAGLYGDINTENYGSLSYQILTGTNNLPKDGGTSRYISSGRFDVSDIEMDTTWSFAGIYADPTGHVRLGVSGYFSDINLNGTSTDKLMVQGPPLAGYPSDFNIADIEYLVASFEFIWESLIFSCEYVIMNSKSTITLNGLPAPFQAALNGNSVSYDARRLGYYGSLSYRINDHFELGYYYSEMHNDRDGSNELIHDYMAWHKESAFALRVDLNRHWIVKLETHYIDGGTKLPKVLNPIEHDIDQYWWMYMAKVSYTF